MGMFGGIGGLAGGFLGGPTGSMLGSTLGGLFDGDPTAAASGASNNAANFQINAAQQGIGQMNKWWDVMRDQLYPWINTGHEALQNYKSLLGFGSPGAQQEMISAIQNGPQMAQMVQQGENAMLQNASATGGLRGGNLQSAMAQFRPQILNQLIQQQLGQLGGLSAMGNQTAMGVGNTGIGVASNIANLYGQQGRAQAGNAMAQGQYQQQGQDMFGNALGMVGSLFGGGGGIGGLGSMFGGGGGGGFDIGGIADSLF